MPFKAYALQQIAYFSYDDDHVFHPDGRSLRYYYPPRLGADLSDGFDTFRQVDDTKDEHIESLLKQLMALEKETGQPCEADIVTWRGMMTKVIQDVRRVCAILTPHRLCLRHSIATAEGWFLLPFHYLNHLTGTSSFEMNATCFQV